MVNYSDNLKFIWWGSGACGSQSMQSLLEKEFDCICSIEKSDGSRTSTRNNEGIPKGKEGYTVIINVRNPYCWELSSFLDSVKDGNSTSFKEYLNGEHTGVTEGHYNSIKKYKPDYFIRCEDMYLDMLKIPNLAARAEQEWVKAEISNPKYKGTREYITKKILSQYWNKDLAKEFSEKYKEMFEITGYDIDSWKTGKHWKGWKSL